LSGVAVEWYEKQGKRLHDQLGGRRRIFGVLIGERVSEMNVPDRRRSIPDSREKFGVPLHREFLLQVIESTVYIVADIA
jgi:hypothetical protein